MNPNKRRFYFDNVGHIFFETNVYGESTIEQEINDFKQLSERNRNTFDVLELPFGAYADDFREGTLIGVDLEKRIPIFSYHNPEEPSEPIIPDVPLSVQIAEIKAENETLKARDSSLQDDITFIFEIMGA